MRRGWSEDPPWYSTRSLRSGWLPIVIKIGWSTSGQVSEADFPKFANWNYMMYERRTLRIIVQGRLWLTSVREFGQVFLDVLCGTCSHPLLLLDYHPLTSVQFIIGFTTTPESSITTSALTTSCAAWTKWSKEKKTPTGC